MKRLKIQGVKELGKKEQKSVKGGIIIQASCPSGCHDFFICPNDGSPVCAVPGPLGNVCFGTHINGQCCL